MSSLFSHASPDEADYSQQGKNTRPREKISLTSDMPLVELWQAFSEYLHLWWPVSLRSSYEAHVELSDQLLIEETADSELIPLAQTLHLVPGGLVALLPLEDGLKGAFTKGLSFTFEETKNGKGSLLEISSGILKPQDANSKEEPGVSPEDSTVARELLGAFAKFMGIPR